jgi:hypothetical protein
MYGREGELYKLDRQRKDASLPKQRRQAADRAFKKIAAQLADKQLMAQRIRLIKAAQAGDELEQHKITRQMRDYLGEDQETGIGYYQ